MRRPDPSNLLGLGLLALAGLFVAVALHGLLDFAEQILHGASPLDLTNAPSLSLPAATAVGAWAVMILRWVPERAMDALTRLSFACIPLLILVPFIWPPVADAILVSHGYERCRPGPAARHVVGRWHRGAPGDCG